MARKNNVDELIHCDACGEDYSATYKRCPFCGEKYNDRNLSQTAADDDDDDDGYVFDGQDLFDDPEDTQVVSTKGGKRLSGTATAARRTTTQSRKPAAAINWPRLITFICSLIIIVAALVIIFTVIYPQLHADPNPSPSLPAAESSAPAASDPVTDPSGEVTPPASAAPTLDPTLNGFTMKGKNDLDFTLRVGETHTLVPVFDPEDWSGEVTFTSSDTNYATVTKDGLVTNVNTTAQLRRVTITVTAGGHSIECTVYCRGTGATASTPPVATPTPTPDPSASASPSQTPSGGLTIGAKGKIVGAPNGLRVRSGPGTNYEVQASLVNGNEVTIVADAGDGWYQISYAGSNGKQTTGYIMGQYISVP